MSAAIEIEKLAKTYGRNRGSRYVDRGKTVIVLSLTGIVGVTLAVGRRDICT
jgi:hypothetical protein